MFLNSKETKHHPSANLYGHPLDFAAVVSEVLICRRVCELTCSTRKVDGRDFSVIRIDRMPTTDAFKASTDPNTRYKHRQDSEYAPELLPGGLRRDLKPIHISSVVCYRLSVSTNLTFYLYRQPQGVSFTVEGELVQWQKWEFTLNFDLREGMVLRNVKYDGRPIFYRMSAAEMTVPYGDPRAPVHRKSAYDFGECSRLRIGLCAGADDCSRAGLALSS